MLAALPRRAVRLLGVAVALMALAGFAAAQEPPATAPAPAAEVPPPPPPPDSEGVVWNMTPPKYPFTEARLGVGGVVILRVAIDAEGFVLGVSIEQSSGNNALDKAATDAAVNWKFIPGLRDGVPVGGDVLVPIRFTPPPFE